MIKQEQQFFDKLAEQWDDIRSVNAAVIEGLVAMTGLREGDRVLDTGCGTGVLVPYVKKVIGDAGMITGVDFSGNMINRAVEKHKAFKGINFLAADIMDYRSADSFNKIICFNFFPHVGDKPLFLQKMRKMLTNDGYLVIMHDIPRAKVNSIHGNCAAVKDDRLPEGTAVAKLLTEAGYFVTDIVDNEEVYFVKAFKMQ